jgi:hypothetical protein
MGRTPKDDLILDFQGLRTENMSSTIPYLNKLNMDAKSLITKLYVPANTKTLSHFNETENYDMYKLFEKAPYVNNNDNNFSETSPFISSDIYKSLLASKQKGGANGKDDDDSDDDDSSTSSSSSNSTDDKKHKKKHGKKDEKHKKDKKHRKTTTESDDSAATTPDDDEEEEEDEESEEEKMFMRRRGGSSESIGSYVSSSAHSDGAEILTVSSKYSRNNKNKNNNNNKNRNGHRNRNSNRNKLSESIDSIDTSDIRLVSID